MINFTDILSLLLTLISLPGTFYLLFITIAGSLAFLLKSDPGVQPNVEGKKIAVVIPAYNEAKTIGRTITSLQHCDAPKGSVDIIVIADNCTDDTAKVARKANCSVIERESKNLRGKGYALQFAFSELANSDYNLYLIVDADTVCEDNLLTEVESKCTLGADAIQAKNLISPTSSQYSEITSLGFKAMNIFRPTARQYLGLSTGLFGTGFALTKETIERVPYTSSSITEDLHYHLLLVAAKLKVHLVSTTGVTSTMPETDLAAIDQRSRWEGGRLQLMIKGIPILFKSVLNKNIIALEPIFELLLLPLSYHLCVLFLLILLPSTPMSALAILGVFVVLLHVLCVIIFTGNGLKDLRIVLQLPNYLLWKVRIVLSTLKQAKSDAKWVPTKRD